MIPNSQRLIFAIALWVIFIVDFIQKEYIFATIEFIVAAILTLIYVFDHRKDA